MKRGHRGRLRQEKSGPGAITFLGGRGAFLSGPRLGLSLVPRLECEQSSHPFNAAIRQEQWPKDTAQQGRLLGRS
jgi:hypothetical protein